MLTPGLTTVSIPRAPQPEVLSGTQQKKTRDREYQRKKRAAQWVRMSLSQHSQ